MADLKHWDLHIELSMREAASLAGGIDPARSDLSQTERARQLTIQSAMEQALGMATRLFELNATHAEPGGQRQSGRLPQGLYSDQLSEFIGNWLILLCQ